MQHDLRLRGPDLDQLPGADPAGGHRVEVAVEGDQAVLADVPQVPLGHHIRGRRQRLEGRVITGRPLPDDLAGASGGSGPAACGTQAMNAASISSTEEKDRPDRTWSRTISTWRSTRPLPVGR